MTEDRLPSNPDDNRLIHGIAFFVCMYAYGRPRSINTSVLKVRYVYLLLGVNYGPGPFLATALLPMLRFIISCGNLGRAMLNGSGALAIPRLTETAGFGP